MHRKEGMRVMTGTNWPLYWILEHRKSSFWIFKKILPTELLLRMQSATACEKWTAELLLRCNCSCHVDACTWIDWCHRVMVGKEFHCCCTDRETNRRATHTCNLYNYKHNEIDLVNVYKIMITHIYCIWPWQLRQYSYSYSIKSVHWLWKHYMYIIRYTSIHYTYTSSGNSKYFMYL